MPKRYKIEKITCVDYDNMIETYNQMYSKDYQLIGYRLYKSSELYQKAVLTLYPRRKGVKKDGKGTRTG